MEHQATHSPGTSKSAIWGIAMVLLAYGLAATLGIPQTGTGLIVQAEHGEAVHPEQHPPYWMVIPFAGLLGAIAVLPLIPATSHWWEHNRHKFYFAAALAAVTLTYYLLLADFPVLGHWLGPHLSPPAESGFNGTLTWDVLANSILLEYVPFMTLLFSLYTISGGIRIQGDLPAHPLTNSVFLAIGGVLASIIGTTGAAMVLIRPLLETNRERKHIKHTVIFFIFVVCNCGGCLLPTGDPPLFLGYLLGVDFLWTLKLWPEWLFVNGMLVAIYFAWDRFWYYPREAARDIARDEKQTHRLRFFGVWPNAFLLLAVIVSVALLGPGQTFPGTDWHPWLYLREIVQLALVGASLVLGSNAVRQANHFNYAAILEVAALFFGIFICMQPPLQILGIEGRNLGLTEPTQFFWATGSLSSVLDNAPTYVVFFETAKSVTAQGELAPTMAGVAETLLIGVSLGAVFMGAMTYIGNGPNFMVKAIAEKSGVRMPSFFGYCVYSILILLPLFAITTLLFLR